jgi:AcrR family transcriptional regulator
MASRHCATDRFLAVSPVRSRRRMPRAQREERMLDAALQNFGERGFRSASMDDIARDSGITKPLLYQYFESKEGLYQACGERERARLFDGLEAASMAAPPRERLRVFVEGYFAYLEEHRGARWLLYGDVSVKATNEMHERNAAVVIRLVRATADELGRSPEATTLTVVAHALIGAGYHVGRWWVEQSDVSRDDAVAQFLPVAAGILAPAFTS